MFAKIFENDTYGQILLKFDANEEGHPEIRAYIHPDGLGVCSLAVSADNDEPETWDKFEQVFVNDFDEAEALKLLDPLFQMLEEGEE